MANQQVVGHSSLVEFYILLEIVILLLVKQVLLCTLRDIVCNDGVTLVELRLVLGHWSWVIFL